MRTPQGTGWKARQDAAKAALLSRYHPIADDPISQARKAMLDAQAEDTRVLQEAYAAKITTDHAVCPCCRGEGHLVVNEAAKIVEALRRYDFVGWKPDPATIGQLLATAFKVDRDGARVIETETQLQEPTAAPVSITETVTVSGATVTPDELSAAVRAHITETMGQTDDDADAGSDEEALAALTKPRRKR